MSEAKIDKWIGTVKHLALSTVSFDHNSKTTRRAVFLVEMDRVVPWSVLCALIEPMYPKPGNGRVPIGLERRGDR